MTVKILASVIGHVAIAGIFDKLLHFLFHTLFAFSRDLS